MATWTAATAIPTGNLITSAWITNVTGMINFLGASGATAGKDLFFARQTVAQVIPNATYTALTFTQQAGEDMDVANGHSVTTNPSRYTAQASGKYRLTGSIALPANLAAQQMVGAFYKNGSLISTGAKGTFYVVNYASAEQSWIMPNLYTSLSAGDYVELMVFKPTGYTTDVSVSQSTFGVEWVGA